MMMMMMMIMMMMMMMMIEDLAKMTRLWWDLRSL